MKNSSLKVLQPIKPTLTELPPIVLDRQIRLEDFFSQHDLANCNLKDPTKKQVEEFNQNEELLTQSVFTYLPEVKALVSRNFKLIPNVLLCSSEGQIQYLMLSNCKVTKRTLQTRERGQCFFSIILQNWQGQLFLIFSEHFHRKIWARNIKRFVKLQNFAQKFTVLDKIFFNYYMLEQKRKRISFTAGIYLGSEFKNNPYLQEVVENEVQLLRTIKHQNFLSLKGVYSEDRYICLLFDQFKGISIFRILMNGLKLDEIQLASLSYQILQSIKFLKKHSFFHGSISPLNCVINTKNALLQIVLVNSSYKVQFKKVQNYSKDYKDQSQVNWLIQRNFGLFTAPELSQGQKPSSISDCYSIGALIFYLTFYQSNEVCQVIKKKIDVEIKALDEIKTYKEKLADFKIDESLINDAMLNLQLKDQNKQFQIKTTYPMVFSMSQLDLMSRLIQSDPTKRISIEEALKHHWFINIRNKIKNTQVQRKDKKPIPCLQTILEIHEQEKEQSLCSIPSLLNPPMLETKKPSFTQDEDCVDEDISVFDQLKTLQEESITVNRPSKLNHDKSKSFQQYKTTVQDTQAYSHKEGFINFKTFN